MKQVLKPRPACWRRVTFSSSENGGGSYDVAPDGQSFVVAERGEEAPSPERLVLVQSFDEELKRLVPAGE